LFGCFGFVCFGFLSFEIGSCFVAQAGLEPMIPLTPPPKCWDCRCASPGQA
jgi:hypothetical protein